MIRISLLPSIPLIAAFLILVIMTIQYPLSVSFPIGGDASFFARRANIATNFLNGPAEAFFTVRVSWYPLSIIIFAASKILPLDWPTRFIWWTVLGHILIGLILARFTYRLGKWPAAAFTMIIWAITTTGITRHVEDATLAQLWSLVFLALFLERISVGSKYVATLALIATVLAHPITGLSLMVTLLFCVPLILVSFPQLGSTQKKQWLTITSTGLLLLLAILFVGKSVFAAIPAVNGVAPNPFINILVSRFAPFVALAPLGLLLLIKSKLALFPKYWLVVFFSLSILLAGNDLLGISVWTQRLAPLFVFSVTILSSLAIIHITRLVFPNRIWQALFLVIFISIILTAAWRDNSQVYSFYENPDNYARPHPDEIVAINWMKNNLSADSIIVTTNKNRHSEWIPVLTNMQWLPVSENDDFLSNPVGDASYSPTYNQLKYVVFFLQREIVRGKFVEFPDQYPLVYSNANVAIYNVPPLLYEE